MTDDNHSETCLDTCFLFKTTNNDVERNKDTYSPTFYTEAGPFRLFLRLQDEDAGGPSQYDGSDENYGDDDSSKYLGIYLKNVGDIDVNIQCGIRLVNRYSYNSINRCLTGKFEAGKSYGKLFRDWDLIRWNEPNWYDDDGKLKIEVRIRNSGAVQDESSSSSHQCFLEEIKSRVDSINDLKLCCDGGEEFEMNEIVFAARSEELRTHLKYKVDGKLTFKHIESDVMKHFVHYLKTETLMDSAGDVALQLAYLADEFNLPRLLTMLEPPLIKQINGKLRQVMTVATKFRLRRLIKAIGEVKTVTEAHFKDEADDLQLEIEGTTYKINHSYLMYRCKKFKPEQPKEEAEAQLKSMLGDIKASTAQGFLDYLKTSKIPAVGEDAFTCARLAEEFALPELERQVESELASNSNKYEVQELSDFAAKNCSVKIFCAIFDKIGRV